MACSITAEKIKENIESRLELISKLYGIPLTEGSIVDSRNVENMEDLRAELMKVESQFGVGSVFHYVGDIGDAVRIKVQINSLPDLEVSYNQVINGEKSNIEKNNEKGKDYSILETKHMVSQFEERKDKLRKFVKDSGILMKKIFKISDTSAVLYDENIIDPNLKNRLKNITQSLALASQSDNFNEQVTAFADYLTEVNILTENINKVVQKAIKDNPKDSFVEINELAKITTGHRLLINELETFFSQSDIKNPIVENVRQTKSNIDSIEKVWADSAENHALTKFMEIYTPIDAEYQAKVEATIARFEASKVGKNAKQIEKIEAAIEKQRANIKEYSPSRENILATLRGEKGDISKFTSFVRSAITNPDFVISGMVDIFKRAMQDVRTKMLGISNEFQGELDEYQKAKGKTIINTETAFENMLVPRVINFYNYETKTIDQKQSLQLINTHNPKFYDDQSRHKASISEQKHLVGELRNTVTDIKVDLDLVGTQEEMITDVTYLTARTQLEESLSELDTRKKALRDWENTHLSNELTDAYYAPDREYLEKYIWKNAKGEIVIDDKQPTDGSEYKYVHDYYNQYNKDLNNLFNAINRRTNRIPTAEQAAERKRLLQEKVKLRNIHDHAPGSIGYATAKHLSEYYKLKKEMYYYETNDARRDDFEEEHSRIKRMLRDGELSVKEYDEWKDEMISVKYAQEYLDESSRINKAINKITSSILSDQGRTAADTTDADQLWVELRTLANKYRDGQGKINGTEFSDAERDKAEAIERAIIRLKDNIEDLRGMKASVREELKELKRSKNKAFKELSKLEKNTPDYLKVIETIKSLGDQIKVIEEAHPISESLSADFERLSDLYQEMSELTSNETTSYYKAEYDKQLTIWLQENNIGEVPETFTETDREGNVYNYTLQADNSYTVRTEGDLVESPVRVDIETVWRATFKPKFKESEWFKENHIEKYEFLTYIDASGKERKEEVLGHKAIYIWRNSFPKSDKHILLNEPSFAWSERVTRDQIEIEENGVKKTVQLKTPKEDILTEIDGKKLPKIGSSYRTDWKEYDDRFREDAAGKKFLEFMRGKFHEGQTNAYNPGRMLGDLIPSIERELNIFDLTSDSKSKAGEQFLRKWTTTDQDSDTDLGDTSGQVAQFLPVYFSGNIDPAIVSKNVYSTILKYTQAAAKHEIVNKDVLPTYKATELTLSKEDNRPKMDQKDAISNAFISKLPNFVSKHFKVQKLVDGKNTTNTRLDVLQKTMNMFAYGEHNIASGEMKILGKDTRWDKIFHNLLGFKSFTSLASGFTGWGLASQFGNAIGATTNQLIKSSVKHGNARFGKKEWATAYKEFTTKYSSQMMDDVGKTGLKSKFGQMTDLFGVFNESGDSIGEDIKKQSWRRRLVSPNMLFFMKNGMELMLGSTTFIATSKSHYIKNEAGEIIVDGEGNKLNVMDAYVMKNNILSLRSDLFDSQGNPTTWSKHDFNRFRGYLQRTRRDVDGAYGSLDKNLLQRHWYGAAIFWMKKFLVPFFENMYSQKRFNFEEGTHIEGYWRTAVMSIPDILSFISASDARSWSTLGGELKEYLTDEQKDAYRQSTTQVALVIAFSLITMLVFGYDDDDPERFKKMEDKSAFANWALYGMLKGRSEAESLVFPFGFDEAGKILKNPVPQLVPYYAGIMKVFSDIEPGNVFSEDPILKTYKSGENKGDIKAVKDFFKLFGVINSKSGPDKAIKGLEYLKRL